MKPLLCFSILIISLLGNAYSQNIFDKEHALRYADHLYNSGEFTEAAEEYERVLAFVPDSLYVKDRLIGSLMNSQDYEKAKTKLVEWYGTYPVQFPLTAQNTWLQLLIIDGNYIGCKALIEHNRILPDTTVLIYRLACELLQHNYNKAQQLIDSVQKSNQPDCVKFNALTDICLKAVSYDRKRPGMAALMSMVLPGSGRAYAGDVQIGIRSFSIIALYTWQSYRGFSLKGPKNVYAWAFGALATGFYSAEIYGAAETARRNNAYNDCTFQEDIIRILLH
jgi:hypothetical protein